MILVWKHVQENYKGDRYGIHGPMHWKRVDRAARNIAGICGGDEDVVSIFAALHDFCRVNDNDDAGHGERAALYAAAIRGKVFDIEDDRFALLHKALERHAYGETSPDPTIGSCWDADRLDLRRVGIIPDPAFMSTEEGRRLAIELQPGPRPVRRTGGVCLPW